MTHYHVSIGPPGVGYMQNTRFDDYDESLRQFIRLGKSVFWNDKNINYQNALIVSEFGEAESMAIGVTRLCVYWLKCHNYPCLCPNWN